MKEANILVVGGTGFIGYHVVGEAVLRGWRVTSLGLNMPKQNQTIANVRYITADLILAETLEQLRENKFDYIVNLGGYIDHTLFRDGGRGIISSHYDGLVNLIENLDQDSIKRFVQIGSSDEYGDVAAPQSEIAREQPISPYSFGKVAATHFLQMLYRTESFPVCILRLFLTYGPGQNNQRFLPQVISGCLLGNSFPVSEGEQLRDFCYIDDVVEAIFNALENPRAPGEIFNVASGEPVSIRNMIETVQALIGKGHPEFGMLPYRKGENMELYADIYKARTILDWQPRHTLEDGLRETINWYASQHD